MGAHLVTGYAGKSHITAADQGQYNAGTVGTGRYALKTGNMFAAEVVSNNLIKIKDGDLVNQGRHIRIAPNDYEECTIDNGLQSVKRNDLIVMRYTQNQDTLVESAQVVVIKGVSGDTAVDPPYTTGDILKGAQTDDYPLYRVKLDGLNITAVEQMFTMIPPISDIANVIYPVGSIYMSVNSVSPQTLFGGTWERITDRFLLSAGDAYAAGTTGGEAEHELSEVEMPSHKHGLNDHTHSIPSLSGTAASNGAHSHSVGDGNRNLWAKIESYGSINATASTGDNKANALAPFTSTNGAHTHNVTTNASTTGAASVNTASAGSGAAHNNMPPYLAVYMWKRTA